MTDMLEGEHTTKCARTETNSIEPGISVENVLQNMKFTNVTFKDYSLDDRQRIVDKALSDFSLDRNAAQSRAFHIVANHLIQNEKEQLRMFVTGMAGTGKSHVIKVIVTLFKRCGILDQLLLSAPTGSTVVLIDGYTVHTLTFMPGKLDGN